MKTKILRKSLSLALSLVILVSMFSICLFSASALDAEFLLDNETIEVEEKIQSEKRKRVEESGMTVYRYHDHPHRTIPDMVSMGEFECLKKILCGV